MMGQLSRHHLSGETKVRLFNSYRTFLYAYILKKNKVRTRLKLQNIRVKKRRAALPLSHGEGSWKMLKEETKRRGEQRKEKFVKKNVVCGKKLCWNLMLIGT